MKKKYLLKRLFLTVLMSSVILSTTTGCAASRSSSERTASDATLSSEASDTAVSSATYVKVQRIDGDTVTAISGSLTEGDNTPSGGVSAFTEGDETITFTLTGDTAITVEYLQGSSEGDSSNITVNSVLELILDENMEASSIVVKNLQSGNGFGGSDTVTNGTSATTIDSDSTVSETTYTSTGDDENALRIDGAIAALTNITVEKNAGDSSNTEDGDFYGQNAALLALNGSVVTIDNATVNTSVANGNGIFSYGDGTTVNISNSVIRTTGNNSGGIQTTGGGTTNATNLDVETQGNSAAAIRSDRGGGTVKVTGGSYTTNGTGSPAIYCTADISASDATLVANNSEGVVVEGENSVSLTNCDVTGKMSGVTQDSDENIHCIMIYQSMSGDAEVGNASFRMSGGSLSSLNGDLFYVTNTTCDISLSNVALTLANDTLLTVASNSSSRGWGTEGANGGNVTLTTDNQTLSGNITVDDISSLSFSMDENTVFTGSINAVERNGNISVTMESSSHWTLTSDSYITSFDGDLTQIDTNGYHLYVNGAQIA